MINSIEETFEKIAKVNEEMADIFRNIAERLLDECRRIKERHLNNEYRGEYHNRDFPFDDDFPSDFLPKINPEIFGDIPFHGEPINLIPSKHRGGCYRNCVVLAFDKWGADKGFKGRANQTISYWLRCLDNRNTLIFSMAWDELDFNQNFKNQFDSHSSTHKTICAVIVTSAGFSIQYLKPY